MKNIFSHLSSKPSLSVITKELQINSTYRAAL